MDVKTTIENGLNVCETEGCNNITTVTGDGRFYAFCDKCRMQYWRNLLKNADNNEFRDFCKEKIRNIKKGE